jgi:hypothetical protein
MNVEQRPQIVPDRERARTRALAQLRQSVWEATQFLSLDEVMQFVHDVLREVESDDP